jgi:predicted outer membrane repeat protein
LEVRVIGNSAAQGGGIYVENGSVSIEGGDVGDNFATIAGGGLFVTSSSANLGADAVIEKNRPTDVACVGALFNGGMIGTSTCFNCGSCTSP